jgi:ferredoxin
MIEMNGKMVAGVNKAMCAGCGICAPVCPENAIEIAQYTDKEIEAMIDGFLAKLEINEKEGGSDSTPKESAIRMEEYPQVWKEILAVMKDGKYTIPQIAENSKLNSELVTYHLMTMNKYGIVVPDGMDDKEMYYYYKENEDSH